MENNKKQQAFFALLRAGLWPEPERHVSLDIPVDWEEVYRLATEQSVLGLVLAGIDCLPNDQRPPKAVLLQWIGEIQVLEQQNKKMNLFIGEMVERMRKVGIYTLLIKGQGMAQCYERPLWRSCGDVDFYLSKDNFNKAKDFFRPLVPAFDPDNDYSQHINMYYAPWVVEIHGDQYTALSSRVDRVIDEIHHDLFFGGNVRSWRIGNTQVFLPSADNDVLIIFSHFLKHFYKGGLGLRQICDWCRLLWTYKDTINVKQLKRRLNDMGVMSIWKAFAAFVVEYLGMPKDAMPLYSDKQCWKRKAEKIAAFLMEVGNFGHNRDTSYHGKYPKLICKMISMWRRFGDAMRHTRIFPIESLRFFPYEVYYGIRVTIKGE